MDFVKIDLARVPAAALLATLEPLRPLPARLVAEKVQTREQAAQCRAAGIDLFQGYYFARPVLVEGRKLSMPQLALLRLLQLLATDADNDVIVEEFKHHPGLSLNMLRIANSAALQRAQPVSSIARALVVVGRHNLRRWVQLLLYADARDGNGRQPAAAARGHARTADGEPRGVARRRQCRADRARLHGGHPVVDARGVRRAVHRDPARRCRCRPRPKPRCCSARDRIGALLAAVEAQEADEGDGARLPACVDGSAYSRHLAEAMAWANQIG